MKAPILKTPELIKACDLMVNIKAALGVHSSWIRASCGKTDPTATCPCPHHGGGCVALGLLAEHKILSV